MLRIQTVDGLTETVDLTAPGEFERWSLRCLDDGFQSRIRGLSIVVLAPDGKELAVLSCPKPKHRNLSWDAAVVFHPVTKVPVREVITCYFGYYAYSLTVYVGTSPIRSRVDVWRPGRRVLRPRAIPGT